jgi:Uma2 family endonuclease
MAVTPQLMTAEELLEFPGEGGFRYELVRGELHKMPGAGHHHGRLAMRVAASLYNYVREHNLGEVYAAETGFLLARDPDTVRAPDVAFIRKERVDAVGDTRGYWEGPPDLAVEVISPHDRYADVDEKVAAWVEAGTRMVILGNLHRRAVSVYDGHGVGRMLSEQDTIEGGEVVPGWALPIRAIFE